MAANVQEDSRRKGEQIRAQAITIANELIGNKCADRNPVHFKERILAALPDSIKGPLSRSSTLMASYVDPYFSDVAQGASRENEFASHIARIANQFVDKGTAGTDHGLTNFRLALSAELSAMYPAELASIHCAEKYINPQIPRIQKHFKQAEARKRNQEALKEATRKQQEETRKRQAAELEEKQTQQRDAVCKEVAEEATKKPQKPEFADFLNEIDRKLAEQGLSVDPAAREGFIDTCVKPQFVRVKEHFDLIRCNVLTVPVGSEPCTSQQEQKIIPPQKQQARALAPSPTSKPNASSQRPPAPKPINFTAPNISTIALPPVADPKEDKGQSPSAIVKPTPQPSKNFTRAATPTPLRPLQVNNSNSLPALINITPKVEPVEPKAASSLQYLLSTALEYPWISAIGGGLAVLFTGLVCALKFCSIQPDGRQRPNVRPFSFGWGGGPGGGPGGGGGHPGWFVSWPASAAGYMALPPSLLTKSIIKTQRTSPTITRAATPQPAGGVEVPVAVFGVGDTFPNAYPSRDGAPTPEPAQGTHPLSHVPFVHPSSIALAQQPEADMLPAAFLNPAGTAVFTPTDGPAPQPPAEVTALAESTTSAGSGPAAAPSPLRSPPMLRLPGAPRISSLRPQALFPQDLTAAPGSASPAALPISALPAANPVHAPSSSSPVVLSNGSSEDAHPSASSAPVVVTPVIQSNPISTAAAPVSYSLGTLPPVEDAPNPPVPAAPAGSAEPEAHAEPAEEANPFAGVFGTGSAPGTPLIEDTTLAGVMGENPAPHPDQADT